MKPQDVFCCSEATGGESILALRIAIEGKRRHARPEDWEVLLQGHHEAFISWAEYLKNQETLMHNRNQLGETVRGAGRKGASGRSAPLRPLRKENAGPLWWPLEPQRYCGLLSMHGLPREARKKNSSAAYAAVSRLSKPLWTPCWRRWRQFGWRLLLRWRTSWPKRERRN